MITSALAFSSVLAVVAGDPGYVRSRDDRQSDASHCLRWTGDGAVVLHLQHCAEGQSTCEAEMSAVRAAIATWNDVLDDCAGITLVEGAPARSNTPGYDPQATSNENVVVVATERCPGASAAECWSFGDEMLGITITTYQRSTGILVDADVELNGATRDLTTEVGPGCSGAACTGEDVQAVTTHELGHLLGLDHVADPASVMYAAYVGLAQRAIDPDSAAAMCAIYPAGQPSLDCGANVSALTEGNGDGAVACRCTRGDGAVGGLLGALGLAMMGLRKGRR